MKKLTGPVSLVCAFAVFTGLLPAQNAVRIDPPQGGLGWLTRPYRRPTIPDVDLNNSGRLEQLVRGGILYLSAQDVVALALENNLDIEIQRYGPLLYHQVTKRAQSGGLLRSVGVGVAAGPQSVSLTGVSLNATGATGSAASVAGVLTQLGPQPPNLDPNLTLFANFAHTTAPQSNTVLTGTTELVIDTRTYEAQYSQAFEFGLNYQLTYQSTHQKFNSSFFTVNPYDSGSLDLTINQPLLNGFGRAVNGRNIYVAKNNEKVGDLQFKQQVITTVSSILNLYWDLVTFYQDLKAKKDELATAQALFEDNKKQVDIGTLAPIEVTRAEAQVYQARQDLLVSQTNLLQQETVLKNALSKNGVASPFLADVRVMPLDTFSIPEKEDIAPMDQLVGQAMKERTEVLTQQLNIDSQKRTLVGIRNALKPNLSVFAEFTNNGLAGVANPNDPVAAAAAAAIIGNYNTLLGQIFRRDFPSYSGGISLNLPLRNRAAQSDYATSVLQLRQTELQLQKEINQVRVDVQNATVGLQQARARYDSAVKARILQQQTLDADKKKYSLGASTVFQVIQDQQALSAAQTTEVQALANYSHFRIQFDQSVGRTLEANHVSIEEAKLGRVSRASVLPQNLPVPESTEAAPANAPQALAEPEHELIDKPGTTPGQLRSSN